MRVIPGMVVASPSDDIEAKAMVAAAYEHQGPVYMRFGRLAVPVINDRPDYKFELGKGIVLREGKDLTIIANGLCVAPALEAAEKLAADGIDAKVINIHTIKPLDGPMLLYNIAYLHTEAKKFLLMYLKLMQLKSLMRQRTDFTHRRQLS